MVPRRRPRRDLLALPKTAAEERQADRHIVAETARIRATWDEQTHRERAGLQRPGDPPPRYTFPTIDARLLGER